MWQIIGHNKKLCLSSFIPTKIGETVELAWQKKKICKKKLLSNQITRWDQWGMRVLLGFIWKRWCVQKKRYSSFLFFLQGALLKRGSLTFFSPPPIIIIFLKMDNPRGFLVNEGVLNWYFFTWACCRLC